MKRLAKYFFQGLLFVAPIAITVFVCYLIFQKIDKPTQELVQRVLGRQIPGMGFLATVVGGVVVITFVGFLSSNILTRGLMGLVERQFSRFPFIKLLHSSLRDLIGAFVGDKKKFDHPVRVELIPGSNVGVIGFITRDDMKDWGLAGQVAVYLPQSYNFAGNLIIVPRERVAPLDVPTGDAMTFVVSGGIAGSENNHTP